MELIETAKYIEMIDSMKGKYRLGFSQEKQKFAFRQKERGSSKIEGMILGGSDYMVSWSLFGDILGDGIGGGFDIQGRLYDINEQEFQKVLGLARTCSVCGDKKTESRWMKEIDSDVGFLRDAEKTIYDAGLVLPAPVSRMELV